MHDSRNRIYILQVWLLHGAPAQCGDGAHQMLSVIGFRLSVTGNCLLLIAS